MGWKRVDGDGLEIQAQGGQKRSMLFISVSPIMWREVVHTVGVQQLFGE